MGDNRIEWGRLADKQRPASPQGSPSHSAASSEPGWRVLLALCRLAGLRRSDALMLKWHSVDWRQNVLDFVQHKTGRRCQPPICPELASVLKPMATRKSSDDAVIPEAVYVGNLDRDFGRLCRRAKIELYAKPLHSLRKSCIDDWAKSGYPPSVVQQWAGSADIKTTMTCYNQVADITTLATLAQLVRAVLS